MTVDTVEKFSHSFVTNGEKQRPKIELHISTKLS